MREYECRDAQATKEMQRAAQAACWRHDRLLALLALHGVSQAEIDAFLTQEATAGGAAGNGNSPSANAGFIAPVEKFGVIHTTPSGTLSNAAQLLRSRPGLPEAPKAENADGDHLPTSRCVTARSVMDSSDSRHSRVDRIPESGGHSCKGNSTSNNISPDLFQHDEVDVREFCPPNNDVADPANSENGAHHLPAHVTPCDAAANIIAELHGHGDTAEARGLLGCKDSRNCHVKNTRLFQLMVETT